MRTQKNRETETRIREVTEITEIIEYATKGAAIFPVSAKRLFCSRTSNDLAYSALDGDGGSRYSKWLDFNLFPVIE
ncbi:hypothetical protein F3A82_23110 [Salmonella enterica subsp. enterica serovar Typhi]|nr:hypothetical protein [Salmonella enterica subsp. enterica serovar Typhi]NRK78787.1 hypothetical protein [Salmonella enterica subsp. enterica serovar Typhi]